MDNRISVSCAGGTETCLKIIRTVLDGAVCGGEPVMKHFLDWFESHGEDAEVLEVARVGGTLIARCSSRGLGNETALFHHDQKGGGEGLGFTVIPGDAMFANN